MKSRGWSCRNVRGFQQGRAILYCSGDRSDTEKFNAIDDQYFGTVNDIKADILPDKIETIEEPKSIDLLEGKKDDFNEVDKFYFTGKWKPSFSTEPSGHVDVKKAEQLDSEKLNYFDQQFFAPSSKKDD